MVLPAKIRLSTLCISLVIAVVAPGFAQATPEDNAPPPAGSNACVSPAPMLSTRGINWYSDSQFSVIDPALRAQHDEMELPLTQFMDAVVLPADGAITGKVDREAIACADRNLATWARAGALTQKPENRTALADQTIAVFGLNVMAIKRHNAGMPVSGEVQNWLGNITRDLVTFYAEGGPRNNMYVWSGAAAAAGNLLQYDSVLDHYATSVWRTAIRSIDMQGHVSSEMQRGKRTLVYHQYFNSALGALNLARQAAGHPANWEDRSAMKRVAAAIGAWACDPAPLERLTGAKQEEFSRWNRAMAYAFNANYLTGNWRRCVKKVPAFSDSSYGGQFDLTTSAISSELMAQ